MPPLLYESGRKRPQSKAFGDICYRVDSLLITTREAFAVRVAVLAAGAILMALEITGFRIIGRNFGSALRETTTVIAVFLVAMSVGYSVGGRIGDRWPRTMTLAAVLMIAAACLLAIPQLDAAFTNVVAASRFLPVHAFVITSLLFAIPTFLLATSTPIAVRLFARDMSHSGSVAGSMSALSTVGSVAGSIGTAFYLIDWIGSINRTVVLLATITSLVAVLLLLVSRPVDGRVRGGLALGGLLFLVGSITFAEPLVRFRVKPITGTRVLFERDSAYHFMTVVERPGPIRDLWMDRTLQSRWYVNDPNERGLDYAEYGHVARLIVPSTRRIAAIGLGGGTLVKQFERYYDDTTIDVVEIDPAVVSVARQFFNVRPGPRVAIHTGDGRVFLKRNGEPYDLIHIDTYTRNRYGTTIPAHMTTREFFQEASRRLSERGIVVFHSYAGRNAPFTRSLYKTMKSVFPSVVVFGETEILASNAPIQLSAEELMSRATALRARIPAIDDRIATINLLPPDPDGVSLLTDDYAPVDTLLRAR